MAKTSRNDAVSAKTRQQVVTKGRGGNTTAKPQAAARAAPQAARASWATDLVFDVREPKLAVSLRLDADVLRFFRGFGAGYQTRINEVLKAFMQARGGAESASPAVIGARDARASAGNGKRAR